MRRTLVFTLVLGLSSCFPMPPPPWADDDGEEEPPWGGDDDDDDDGDGVEIQWTDPQSGETDVYHRCDITVAFTDPLVDGEITLIEDGSYEDIPGNTHLSENGQQLVFDPYGDAASGALRPETSYLATVVWGHDRSAALSFTTSDVGDDVPEPEHFVVGKTYQWDLGTLEFTQPPGMGNLLPQLYTEASTFVHVVAAEEDEQTLEMFTFLGARDGNDWVQDPCVPTVSLSRPGGDLFHNPYFRLGPAQTEELAAPQVMDFLSMLYFIDDLIMEGSFTPDGSGIAGATIAGTLDMRSLDDLIDPNGEEGAACDLLSSLGIECEPCADGSGTFCLTLEGHGMDGEEKTIRSSDPVSGEQVDAPYEITSEMLEEWYAEGWCGGE